VFKCMEQHSQVIFAIKMVDLMKLTNENQDVDESMKEVYILEKIISP